MGDNITLSINNSEYTVTIAGVLSDSPLARSEGTETIFCSEETFTALTGETGYTIIDVQFQNNASEEDVRVMTYFPMAVLHLRISSLGCSSREICIGLFLSLFMVSCLL